MKDLQRRIAKLAAEILALHKSLAIEALWPDAFDNGAVKARWTGNMHYRFSELTFTIRDGKGEERDFNIKQVPVILWEAEFVRFIQSYTLASQGGISRKELKEFMEIIEQNSVN